MQPWLKSRRARAKSDCAGVPCMYTFSEFGKMNLARPSEFFSPGFWRTKSLPAATLSRFSGVAGSAGASSSPLATISMFCRSR